VTSVSRLDLSTFPDSPYAAELQRSPSTLRFAPELETDYLKARLADSRTLIRVACAFSVAMTASRIAEHSYTDGVALADLIPMLLVVVTSLALAGIAWSPGFMRLYPKWAEVLVPAKNSLIALQVASAAAHGQPEMLLALPITLIGPFFFLGLPFRASLLCCAATIVTYVIGVSIFAVPHLIAMHSYVLLAGGIAACVIAVWHLEKVSRKSFLESQLIRELAQRDALTGTRNRRVFDEHLETAWQQALVNRRTMAILLIDIDHFKAYNDHYGHQAGDQALRRVAQTVQKMVRRPSDILTRYGGEEFAAILCDIDAPQAREIAERIRCAVGDLCIEHRASRTATRVTISVGVAVVEPSASRSALGAVQLADQALYEAKVQGRNRVEVMDRDQHDLLVTGVFSVSSIRSNVSDVTTIVGKTVRSVR